MHSKLFSYISVPPFYHITFQTNELLKFIPPFHCSKIKASIKHNVFGQKRGILPNLSRNSHICCYFDNFFELQSRQPLQLPIDHGTYKSRLLRSTSPPDRAAWHSKNHAVWSPPHMVSIRIGSKQSVVSFLKFTPLSLLKIKGLYKAQCFRAKYNRISQSFLTIITFAAILITFVNYKSGSLCACYVISIHWIALFLSHRNDQRQSLWPALFLMPTSPFIWLKNKVLHYVHQNRARNRHFLPFFHKAITFLVSSIPILSVFYCTIATCGIARKKPIGF